MDFLGIGPWELLLILFIALLVMGPGKLPEMGRTLGRIVRQLRKAVSDAAQDLTVDVEEPKSKPSPPEPKSDQTQSSPGAKEQ